MGIRAIWASLKAACVVLTTSHQLYLMVNEKYGPDTILLYTLEKV
jgi:hypothetical protein